MKTLHLMDSEGANVAEVELHPKDWPEPGLPKFVVYDHAVFEATGVEDSLGMIYRQLPSHGILWLL